MYRTAALARRLLSGATARNNSNSRIRYLNLRTTVIGSRYCTAVNNNHSFPQSIFNQNQTPRANLEFPNQSESTSSSDWSASSTAEDGRRRQERQRPRIEYEEQQARVLEASLHHVLRLGWSEEAMIAGARDVGVSPSIVGSFPRKEAALVEFFMDECLQKLIDRIDSGEGLQNLVPSDRISKLLKIRLEMQSPYISKWPQVLSIQAYPSNAPTSFKQRAMLVDEIWHAIGDEGSDIDWYVKRTVLGGIYSTTEIYMLTDSSPGSSLPVLLALIDIKMTFFFQWACKNKLVRILAEGRRNSTALIHFFSILEALTSSPFHQNNFRDTWAFLEDRVKDAFDLKKSIQEVVSFSFLWCSISTYFGNFGLSWEGKAMYMAEAVGAGMGNSFQGFVGRLTVLNVDEVRQLRGGRRSSSLLLPAFSQSQICVFSSPFGLSSLRIQFLTFSLPHLSLEHRMLLKIKAKLEPQQFSNSLEISSHYLHHGGTSVYRTLYYPGNAKSFKISSTLSNYRNSAGETKKSTDTVVNYKLAVQATIISKSIRNKTQFRRRFLLLFSRSRVLVYFLLGLVMHVARRCTLILATPFPDIFCTVCTNYPWPKKYDDVSINQSKSPPMRDDGYVKGAFQPSLVNMLPFTGSNRKWVILRFILKLEFTAVLFHRILFLNITHVRVLSTFYRYSLSIILIEFS
ncbi:hypothetical protein NC653_016625 [Populus alba x Populus x berolinensis]|uniref:Ubiquinone biosynthesis protein n=1 Tax=Populus alba x Populus x berolinensis TaxID=444605 RepID=A0AAD6QNC0_9ROSI|nr:hypothetical protein NC653_016625 [Populus alba x Populus x berolinensis]